jgi:hypothetical protein
MEELKRFLSKSLKFSSVLLIALSMSMTLMSCDDDDSSSGDDTETINISDGGTLQGTYSNQTVNVAANATIKLQGTVKFGEGSSLNIAEGVTVKGDSTTLSYLIIDRGAQINAQGTETAPITFTSDKADGERGREDWGGIVINGYAPVNIANPTGEGESGSYGGNDANDNSGILKYVRVYFAGKKFNEEDELNGIAFQGVGDGTTIDYLQAHNCSDDGVEFFGGTVDVKHVVSTGNGDDQFDWTSGWQGKGQFLALAVIEGSSEDPRGIEGDNDKASPKATPVSTVELYNVTFMSNTENWADDSFRIRRGTQATLGNIYAGVGGNCGDGAEGLKVTEAETNVTISAALFEGYASGEAVGAGDDATVADNITQSSVTTNDTVSYLSADNFASLAALETAKASAFMPASAETGIAVPADADGFFDTTADFIGAVGSTNWINGWTSFPAK